MELRQTLLDIVNDARGWLKVWAADFTEGEATRTVPGGPNPIAWQLGHLALVQDDVYTLFRGKPPELPASLRSACASGGPAPAADAVFPTLAELWQLLEATHGRLLELVASAQLSDFDRESSPPNRYFRTLGQAIYEVALHENYHVGQIAALRKALGKPKIG
jgi:uncharacterized damage-inducible protein DinB